MNDSPPPAILSALVVDPDRVDRTFVRSSLEAAGFSVTSTTTYEEASASIVMSPPLVLVTAIRLGAFNGIHLALRGRAERARMALVVTSPVADAVLQRDAEQLGATFVRTPIASGELLVAIQRTMFRQRAAGGAGDPVRAPFERRHADRRVQPAAVAENRRQTERRRDVAGLLRAAVIA